MPQKNVAFCNFVSRIELDDTPIDNAYECIFDQYERVIVQALATSFGLDFLVNDRYGGDVDTIHNVREIGKAPQMTYKNSQNATDYENRGDYNSTEYHSDENYRTINAKASAKKKAGDLTDSYTGEKVAKNAKIDLDHAVSAKEIHDDPGRVLAGVDGKVLANCEENLNPTDRSINRSMGQADMDEYLKKRKEQQPERQKRIKELNLKEKLSDKERKELEKLEKLEKINPDLMKKRNDAARKAYNTKLNRVYYTSPKFWKDTSVAAAKLGLSMGLRQALGLVFTEIWFSVRDAIFKCNKGAKNLFEEIAKAVKKGINNAKKKFQDVWRKFIEGAVAGVLSSLVTTLANIFFTTAKNIIKIIRESFASLTRAFNILFVNPDGYPLGDRFIEAAKVVSTGASVVAGTMVAELLRKTPVGTIPIVGEILPTFCNVLVTGIMSCSFLHLLDRNELLKKAIKWLNNLPDIDNFAASLRKQGELLTRYLSELMKIDFDLLKRQEESFSFAAKKLSACKNAKETTICLHSIYKELNLSLPWAGYAGFDSFMNDKNSRLVFA
ncbi:MAG: hypothetical protein IK015_09765 [Treponema sp.]|nr:hypothetical protein [Treponema sp.]